MIYMAGFIKRLFSKPEPKVLHLSFDEVGGYLEDKEKEASLIVEGAAERARAICNDEKEKLIEKVHSVAEKEVRQDSHPSPKVRNVTEKSIPRFSSSMEKALSHQLTSDPELLYEDIVGMIRSIADSMKKHGRYIAAVFPDDMKSVKSSLDEMGRALNAMTEEVKPAVEIRSGVSGARSVYERIRSEMTESGRIDEDIPSLEDGIMELDSKSEALEGEVSALTSGGDYLDHVSSRNRLSALLEEKEEIGAGFEHLRSSCMNVFRKSAYIADKDNNHELTGDINRIMELLESSVDATPGAVEIYTRIYPSLREITEEHEGILKNSDEIELFSSAELFSRRLGDIVSEYRRVDEEISSEEEKLAGSGIPGELEKLESEKKKVQASIGEMRQKISESESRRSEIAGDIPGRMEDLRSMLAGIEETDVDLETGWEELSS